MGRLGLRIGAFMLKMPEVDGHLQLMPLVRQPKVYRLEVGVNGGKLFSKPTQCTRRLPEDLVADSTVPTRKLKRAAGSVLHAGNHRGSLRWLACS